MRIQLYLTPPCLPSSSDWSSSISSTQQIPGPLTALTPSGELILIELQGSLEMDSSSSTSGQVVGELMWGDGKEDKPTLLLSHHKLEGKLVNLTKPLAVLKKCKRSQLEQEEDENEEEEGDQTIRPISGDWDDDDDDETNTRTHALPPSSPPNSQDIHLQMRALVDDSDDDDGDAGGLEASPSLQRGKKRPASPAQPPTSSREPQHTPTKSRRTDKSHSPSSSPPSSSPAPRPPMRGSAIDFSSPPPRETTLDTRQRRTQVSYDVVCVIRKKVLFSKRPEPVVHRAA